MCIDHRQKGNHKGYGSVKFEGKTTPAHRAAYYSYNNVSLSDIKGKVIMHTCDNPRCINPLHFVLGSHKENMEDRQRKGRTASGEKSGVCKFSNETIAKIFKLREEGLTQQHISDILGMSRSYVGLVLAGKWRKHDTSI